MNRPPPEFNQVKSSAPPPQPPRPSSVELPRSNSIGEHHILYPDPPQSFGAPTQPPRPGSVIIEQVLIPFNSFNSLAANYNDKFKFCSFCNSNFVIIYLHCQPTKSSSAQPLKKVESVKDIKKKEKEEEKARKQREKEMKKNKGKGKEINKLEILM